MKIIITFRRKDNDADETTALKPEEYIDPIEPGETYENDAITRLDHTHDYLSLTPAELDWAQVDVRSDEKDFRRSWRTDYYSDGAVEVTQTTEMNEGVFDEEIIVSTSLGPNVYHVVRLYRRQSPHWSMTLNSVGTLNDDGSETAVKVP